jgi:hypothetical protein
MSLFDTFVPSVLYRTRAQITSGCNALSPLSLHPYAWPQSSTIKSHGAPFSSPNEVSASLKASLRLAAPQGPPRREVPKPLALLPPVIYQAKEKEPLSDVLRKAGKK